MFPVTDIKDSKDGVDHDQHAMQDVTCACTGKQSIARVF